LLEGLDDPAENRVSVIVQHSPAAPEPPKRPSMTPSMLPAALSSKHGAGKLVALLAVFFASLLGALKIVSELFREGK
jgi:hypothetical protein